MTTQPTTLPPGSYRFEPGETADTYRMFAAGEDKPIVEMIYIGGDEEFEAIALNLARLFAAGPDLLAALTAVLADAKRRRYSLADNITDFARAAIANAIGRAA